MSNISIVKFASAEEGGGGGGKKGNKEVPVTCLKTLNTMLLTSKFLTAV